MLVRSNPFGNKAILNHRVYVIIISFAPDVFLACSIASATLLAIFSLKGTVIGIEFWGVNSGLIVIRSSLNLSTAGSWKPQINAISYFSRNALDKLEASTTAL